MANNWLRLWHDMPSDPKWRTIARVSGQPISLVIATYISLLVDASRNVTRGHANVTTEDIASQLDVTEVTIESILNAMQGRVLDGNRLTGWGSRQPKTEDAGNPETGAKSALQRKREQRERVKNQGKESHCHDASRNVTTDKDKDKDTEKRKEITNTDVFVCAEQKNSTPPRTKKATSQDDSPTMFELPLNKPGTHHAVTQKDLEDLFRLYPAVDVTQQIRQMIGWLNANPTRRKTKSGVKNFINSWLAKEQNKAGSSGGFNRPTAATPQANPQPMAYVPSRFSRSGSHGFIDSTATQVNDEQS